MTDSNNLSQNTAQHNAQDDNTNTSTNLTPTPKRVKKAKAEPLSATQVAKWLFDTSKILLKPDTYRKQNLSTQWQRSKRVTRLGTTIQKGVSYAWLIHNTDNPEPKTIIGYIQKFCRKSLDALEVEVIAVEPIPQTHALWASNHISWLDIPVVGSMIPTFFLSKAEIAKWPVIGWLATAANTLFIERGSGDADEVSQQMAKFLRDGYPVVFFPEATTTDGRAVKRIHGKLLQSAMDAQVPIQPIVICYVDDKGQFDQAIPYYGDMNFLQSVKRVLDNRPAKAYVLPLEPIEPANHSRAELTAMLQTRMSEGLQQLHRRIIKSNQ